MCPSLTPGAEDLALVSQERARVQGHLHGVDDRDGGILRSDHVADKGRHSGHAMGQAAPHNVTVDWGVEVFGRAVNAWRFGC